MVKKVFVYGDKIINDKLPDIDDQFSMLKVIDEHLAERKPRPVRSIWRVRKRKSKKHRTPRSQSAKRHDFHARVLIHKNNRYLKGNALNISRTGIFVESPSPVFKLNEAVNLTIKIPTGGRYKVVARVIRYNTRGGGPKGYGLHFVKANK